MNKRDHTIFTILAGVVIIYLWSILVVFPAISGTTIELLMAFSILPTCLTFLWFIGVVVTFPSYGDDNEEGD